MCLVKILCQKIINGKLLKMVTQIDGSFGPVAATAAATAAAAAAAAAATPLPHRGGGLKRIGLLFRFGLF